jgi:hypothetical protein
MQITLCKTEVIDSIKEVGFAHAIASANANNPPGKGKTGFPVVFKLEDRYRIESQQRGLYCAVNGPNCIISVNINVFKIRNGIYYLGIYHYFCPQN